MDAKTFGLLLAECRFTLFTSIFSWKKKKDAAERELQTPSA